MSEEVTVQFFGICTHVKPDQGDVAEHRVILVNASDQKRIDLDPLLHEKGVKVHVARLQIQRSDLAGKAPVEEWFQRDLELESPDVVVWKLEGVTLTIPSAVARPSGPDVGRCIPSLSEYSGTTDNLPLRTTAEAADPLLTACFVDLPGVTMAGRDWQRGAAVGLVTLDVQETPSIKVTRFGAGGELVSIPIKAGAVITVSNYPKVLTEETEKDPDFLLHFLVLAIESVPATATYPTQGMGCGKLTPSNVPVVAARAHGKGMSGPGCSNSLYP